MGKLSVRDRKLANRAGLNVGNVERRNFELVPVARQQTYLLPALPQFPTSFLVLSQWVSWVYLGYVQKNLIVDYVQFIQALPAAAGTQTVEVGLATSTSAPSGASKLLTVIAVASDLPNLTAGNSANGVIRQNLTALNCAVTPATHLWAFVRFAMGTTQPTVRQPNFDLQTGSILLTATHASPVALGEQIVGGTVSGAILGDVATTVAYLRAVCRV